MPLPRMTTRRWMILVALLAVGLGWGLHLDRLEREYQSRTLEFSRKVGESEADLALLETRLKLRFPRMTPAEEAATRLEIRKLAEDVAYYKRMHLKYKRAHRRPWLPVPPDPPKPK